MKNQYATFFRKTTATFVALIALFLISTSSNVNAQTVLISPTGDGGFETGTTFAANGWTTALPGTARQWQVGTAAGASAGTRAAYLGSTSNYNGVAAYAIGHFYRDVIIPPGATNVFLNYYYRQTIIDGSWDYFYIFTTTPAYTPVSGTTPGAGYTQQFVNTSTTYAAWTSMPQINLTALAGTTVRLVFTYYSDGVTPHFNPAVDRISLVYTPAAACSGTPATPTATISASTGCASTNFTLSATGATTGTGITYSWESSPTGGAPWTPTGGTTLSYVTSTATTMYYRLITTCNVGGSSTSTSVSYTPVVCCSHRLECYDSFGDGWNGGSVNLYVGGNLVGNYTVASGYGPTTVNFNAPGGGAIQVTMAAAGSYPTEMYINVYDGMNNPLVTNYYINNGTWNGTAFCPSPCTGIPAPGNTLSSVVGACLGVPFTLSLQNPTAGSGVTYQWQSSPDGTSWSPIGGANSSTYTGTQVSATYYNCIVTCSGNNGTSTSLFLPMSLPNDCYCIPVGSASYYLSNVNTTGGVTNFNNSTGGSVGGYGDYHLTQSCSVLQGGTITISLTPSITTDYFYIWLDLNQDGDFIDAGEQIGYSGGYFASYSLAYTVPLIQAAGSYRMRVANSYIGTVVPCGPSSYGEYEDYTLTVIALTNCAGTPATPVASISSASGCNGTNFNLNATGIETGSGISYQWQTSADGLTGWVSTGGTTVPYTTSSATTAYYQLVTTCSLSGLTSTSNVVSYTALPCTNINVPISGFNEVACGLNANIYDDGGPGGNYSNYDNGYTVLNNAGVGTITLTGTYSGIETCCDYIQIYSGVGTGGTLLATYGAAGSGTITPIVSGLGQALTIRFYSDLSGVGAGFALMSTFSGACTFGPPSITSFTPSTGCPNGTLVTITGTDFFGATAVNFGGVPAASYTVVDGTTITATPALGATGTIEVITPGGTVTSAGTFTFYAYPVITVQPEAPAAGFCGGVSTANISVTATGATTYQWYRNGVLLTNTAPYSDVTTNTITVTNPTVAENGVLLTCVIGNGTPCSVTTNAVSIIVGVAPADPTSVTATPNSICLGATSNLNAISAGNNINWWSAAVGGTLLGNSASGVNLPVTPIVTTTYYAEANTGSTGSQTFNYSGSIANWTVPAGITSVTITAIGAGGGITTGYTPLAGKGAKMVGTFAVTPGATLKILVGAKGADGTTTSGGGGGGGTFVTDLSNTPLIVAGGGGGIAVSTSVYTPIGADAVITTSGVSGNSASGGSPANYGIGGVGGNGATNTATGACGGNGGGLLTNGTANASCCPNTYGYAFVNGGAGGTVCTSTGNGGFGGGGGGGNTASGGGGGYSGGGASWNNPTNGGGGGSYNNGTAQTNTAGFNAGNGSVIISWNNAGCPSVNRVPVTVTVGTYPVITAQPATPSPICGTGTRTFSVTATGTSLYQWYRNGVLLPEAAPYSGTTTNTLTLTDPSVGENGVSITCVLGFAPCTATTNPVILNIAGGSGPPPPSPVTATPNSICAGATSNLNAISAGNQINWWTSATGGSLIGSTPSGINFPVTPITTTTYYAESNTGAAGTQTFNYTGGLQTWIVPAGVVSIDVDVQGAKGGDGISTGGLGGRIQATYPVTPGQTLNIYVGGAGSGATAGYNGGGAGNASYGKGGGGASDIRIGGTALANRVFVAGGGGGAGDNCATTQEWGGHGGGLIGQGGFQCNTEGTYATGGSQVAGGTGGSAAGTLGVGGAGSATYGGGGGGGYYGGGGASYGGGGGGSNYSNASATAVINTRGYRSGNGIISITYNAPGCPSATRESVVVTVGTIPTITTQPLSPLPICGTGIRTLEVLATGTSTYQWYRNGVILTNTAPYSGVTTNILTITDPAIGENGVSLTCVLGISPCTITTNAVLLSVVGAGGTPLPNPVTATPSSLCFGATANLNAVSAGNQINWYTAATAGTLLGTTASAVNFPVTPLVTTTYYAESYSGTSGSQTFNYSGSIVNFTIPGGVTSINITAKGASGGYQSSGTAGKGASMTGTFAVTPGQSLSILVGQSPGLTTLYPAGGGGTYVGLGASYATATPLIVAGGGGAAYSGYTGTDAPITTSGTGTTPGTGGNGAAAGSCTGGGGGFYTSGGTDLLYGYTGGSGFHQGGAGGIPNATYGGASYQVGGFGGGAPADYWGSCYSYAGNGGGYSGGSANGTGAVYSGNAGGSFNGGTAQVNIAGNNNGNGQVVISWFSPGCPSATRVPVTVTLSSPVAADAITSNSPQCAGTAITFTKGTCPTGSTCYWVSSANGTEVSNSSPTYTSATTAGTYTVFVRPYNGICWGPAVSLTGIITEAPTTVTVTPASAALCIGGVQSLVASGGNINVPILSENFNGPTNTWTKINNTTGGTTPANTAWTLQPNGYFDPVYPAMIFHSNDNSQFYISNSNAGGAGNNTATILQSPSFSTVGYSAVSLKFWHHYYKTIANADAGYVEASINGTTWTTLTSYTTSQGTFDGFVSPTVALTAPFINQPIVYVRFRNITTGQQWWWAVDNVSVIGVTGAPITWTPTSTLYTNVGATTPYVGGTAATTVYAKPTANTTYSATATSGCTTVGTSAITVTELPGAITSNSPQCSGAGITFTKGSCVSGTCYWVSSALGTETTNSAPTYTTSATPGTYTVWVRNYNGVCWTDAVSATGTVFPVVSTPGAITSNSTQCAGTGVTFTKGSCTSGTCYWVSSATGTETTNSAPTYTTPSTMGVYTVWVRAYDGNCWSSAVTASGTVLESPSALTVTPTSSSFCAGAIQQIDASGGTITPVNNTIFTETFNAPTNGWTKINNSTGGIPSAAAWTLTPSSGPWQSNDNSQFYLSNSDAQGSGGNTSTILQSPVFNTIGYTTASLRFYHYYSRSALSAKVDYSLDGTSWINMKTYIIGVGAMNGFAQDNIAFPAGALNQPTVYIRFKYDDSWGYYWAIDNVTVTGDQNSTPITWTPATNLYTNAGATTAYIAGSPAATVYAKPVSNITYTATATAGTGCTSSGTSAFTVYSAVTASISGGTSPICYGTNPGILTATGSGGSGSYTYLWYKNGISTGLTTQTYDPGILYTTPNSFYCEVDGGLCGMANTPTTTITIETEPPIITCPVNINQTADAGVCNAAVSIVDPTATDNCSTNFIFTGVRSDALALSATYPVGVTTINWTATDEAGNVSLGCDQTITITDDEIPAITCSGNINQTADPGVCDAAITVPTPANSDNCGLASIVNDYNNSADASDTYPVGTTTVVWTVTDIHGNINNCSQIITITDNEVPSISCSADMTQTADLGVCNAAMTVITPATNDNCSVESILNNYNGTANASDTYPVGTTTVVWTVTDIHGNTNSCTQLITVTDDEIPAITCSGDMTQTADPGVCNAAITVITPATSDNCGVASVINNYNSTADATDTYPVGTTTVVWTVTDVHGNTNSCTQIITVTDDEIPAISCYGNINQTADPGVCQAAVTVVTPINSDNCAVASIVNDYNNSADAGDTYPVGTTTVVWTVTDIHGNTNSCSQIITITDNEVPSISCSADMTQTADPGVCNAAMTVITPATNDNCGIASILNNYNGTANASDTYPVGTTTVVWTVTDIHGNTNSCTQLITVTDDEIPAITCSGNMTQTADPGVCNAAITVIAPATSDNCGVASLVNNYNGTADATDTYPVGTTTVVWTVTDVHGNTNSCTQIITVTDDEIPAISCYGNINQTADPGVCQAAVTVVTPINSDNCAVASIVNDYNNSADASDTYPVGTTTVVWTVTDIHGNTNSCSQIITITDNEVPSISCSADMTQTADLGVCNAAMTVITPATADNCGVASILNNYNGTANASDTYLVGTTTVVWTVTDIHGNTNSCTQLITVTDNEIPAITCSGDMNQTADPGVCQAAVTVVTPATSDNCAVASVVNNYNGTADASDTYLVGTTSVVWTVTDVHGNTNTCTQLITVTDNEIPSITCVAQTQTADPGVCQAAVTVVTPINSDNCAVATIINNYNGTSDASDIYPVGITTVVWTVTDIHGNTNTCSQLITVTDDEIPSITCAPDQSQTADPGVCQAAVTVVPPISTSDNCGVASVINNFNNTTDASGTYPVGTTTVIWTVTDIHNNINTCSQLITVTDNEIPSITCAGNMNQTADPGVCNAAVTVITPTTADNCDVASILNNYNGTADASDTYPVGTTTLLWTVTDIHGNTNTCTQDITVTDDEVPTVICGAPITQTNDSGVCEAFVTIPIFNLGCGVQSGFTGYYAPTNWNLFNTGGGSGFVNNIGAPGSIYMEGSDNWSGMATETHLEITIPCTGALNYNWNYHTNDWDASYDPMGYYLNGVFTQLSDNSGPVDQNGTVSIPVSAGDMFSFCLKSDNAFGASLLISSNFSAPIGIAGIATDNCGIATIVNDYTGTDNASDTYPVGTTTVTWTVTDIHGNSNTCTQDITVTDNEIPSITCAANQTQTADPGVCQAVVTVVAPITADNCGVESVVNNYNGTADASGVYLVGTTTVIWTVTDIHGNINTCTQDITVTDNEIPSITCAPNQTQTADPGVCQAYVSVLSPTAADNCGVASVVNNFNGTADASGTYLVGTTTVTWTVTDIHGNINTCLQDITVTDNEAPTISCPFAPYGVVRPADPGVCYAAITIPAPTVNDNCGILSVVNDFNGTNDASGNYPVGTTTITWTVTDIHGNVNTCQDYINVTDTQLPVAIAQDITIYLDANGFVAITPVDINNGSTDNCSIINMTLSQTVFNCSNVGPNTVTLTVTDASGNTNSATAIVTVVDNTPPTVFCNNITVQLDVAGNATISASQVYNSAFDACGIGTMSVSPNTFTCANVGTNLVTLTVNDIHGNSGTCSATVTIEDVTPPVAICQNVTINLDATGHATITAAQINNGSHDACGIASLTVSPANFTCANLGINPVTLTVTDIHGNVSTCNAAVTVVDNTPPIAICKNITVQLDPTGNVTITGAQINNGSTDACGIASLIASPNTFNCANVGTNSVTLTVIDNSGNTSTCTSIVTVKDNVPPVAICKNITVYLNAFGNVSITGSQINNGSTDACGIASLQATPYSFNCTNIGPNMVTLTVTDLYGNVSTCTSIVTVKDTIAPIAICKNILVQLNSLGNATITGAQIDNGSNDACGIASMVASPSNFTCANVGTNNVTLIVTDINGNVSTCTSTVTVVDLIAPIVVCQNLTIPLNASGNATITSSQINNGSSDACGIASMVVTPNSFTCANVGVNNVTLTITDVNGNTSSCTSTVTVVDNTAPVAICKNINVYLDQAGHTSIVAADVNNGSTDACGIASISVLPNTFSCSNVGSNAVTLTVTDIHGNISTCTSVVNVFDTIQPVISCPANIVVNTDPGSCTYSGIVLGYPTFSDNCSVSSIVNNAPTIYPIGITQVTWTITDGSGNVSSCAQTVTVHSAPLAVNDYATTAESTPVMIPVLANDIDCGNDLNPSTVVIVNPPANGSVSIDPITGNITYTPNYLFTGNDQFNYQVCDYSGLCSTAIVFINVLSVNNPMIGIAKAVSSVTPQPDNSFDVTYVITVDNLGNDLIENIQVTDNLASIFNAPATYTVLAPPNTNNNLTPNHNFDGNSDINLLESATSFLAVGKSATITFTVHVTLLGLPQTYCNTAVATGTGSMGSFVSDTSTNGYLSDPNGNGNPGDVGENECTPVTLTPIDVFIPQAFSPDGDGINDFFVINGIEEYPDNELTIFNRWGNKVFNMKPYDNKWDAKPNQALNLGSQKLPQGTYYYIFEYNKDNREPKTGFVVIKY